MRILRLVWRCGQWLALALFLTATGAWWWFSITAVNVTLTPPVLGEVRLGAFWVFTEVFGDVLWTTLWGVLAAVSAVLWLPTLRRWFLRDRGAHLQPKRWAWRLLLAALPAAWLVLCYVDYEGRLGPDVFGYCRVTVADRCVIAGRWRPSPRRFAPQVRRFVGVHLNGASEMDAEDVAWPVDESYWASTNALRYGFKRGRFAHADLFVLSPVLTLLLLLPLALPLAMAQRVRCLRRNRAKRNACMTCGYSLQGLPERRCPECGTDAPAVRPAPRRPTWAWRVALLALPAAAWLLWGWMQFDADHALFAGDNPPSEPLPNAWLFVGGAPPEPADGPEARSSVFFVQEARHPFEDPAPTWRDGDDFGFRVVSWDGRRSLAIRASFIVWTAHLAAIPLALALLRRGEMRRNDRRC